MNPRTLAGAIAGTVALAAPTVAVAAPVTVDLRVEGPTRTLIEQKVTVDVRKFKFSNSPQTYECDGTSSTGGSSPTPAPVRNGALAEAAERGGLELTGSFGQFGATFERINGEGVAFNPDTNEFLGEYENGAFAQVGGCADTIVDGDDVLYAYGTGSEQLLELAGPATVKPGEAATFTVTDQAGGAAVASASVGGATTGSDGRARTAALTQRGPQTFKATKSGTIRSNAVTVCVTDGADGFCGTTKPGQPAAAPAPAPGPAPMLPVLDTFAAFGKIGSIREGRRFARGRGPRTLAGTVDLEASGLRDVRVRLSRKSGRTCSYFDATRERFVTTRRCGIRNARTFSVGANARFSYLLPSALPAGRYVLDVVVLDRAKNQTLTYQRGRNRVVFTVG